jgi:zinc transporter ZupT
MIDKYVWRISGCPGIAFAAGFLLTTVTQSMIPEANKEGEPSFAGILFLAGLTLYAVLTLTIK